MEIFRRGRASPPALGARLVVETASSTCDSDVAFIVLDRAIDAPVAPIRIGDGARVGESVTVAGWGMTNDGDFPSALRERKGVRVQAVGPYAFDARTSVGLGPSEFMTGEAACVGDSGGPAFATSGAVVGVVSRGGNRRAATTVGNCIGDDTLNIYTQLVHKRALVDRAFALAGYAPREEGTPPGKVAGEPCAADIDCSSRACVSRVCRAP